MHVAVVGGGIFGQVIAWRLATKGHEVTLVEPIGPGHAKSASGDRSRIVRALYDEPCFSASGHASLALWNEWSAELGARLVETNGVLYFVGEGASPASLAWRAWVDRGVANVRALGGEVRWLSPSELSARFPAASPTGLHGAAFEPRAGFGRPALACRAIARASLATGRVKHVTAKALQVLESGGRAKGLTTSEANVDADAVVVAAGFDGVDLVEPFVGRLGIRRLPHWVSYWDVPYPEARDLAFERLPCWVDLGVKVYGFPDDGESGFKVAWHEPRGGDHGSEAPTPDEIEELRAAVQERFPAMARATCRGTFSCAYDATADEMFQVGPVPGVLGLTFAGAFSGHGFKHAPALGESVARLVSGEAPLCDLSPYALRAGR